MEENKPLTAAEHDFETEGDSKLKTSSVFSDIMILMQDSK